MIKLFRRSSPLNMVLLIIYAIGLHAYLYLKPFDPTHIHIASPLGFFLFQWLYDLPVKIPILFASLTIFMSLCNGLLFNYTLNYYKLIPQFSFLPAYIFITLSGCLSTLDLFSPEILTCFFFLLAMHRLLGIYKSGHSSGVFFDMGLMLSIAILFVPAYWAMVLFFFASFIILRPFAILEWGAAVLGLIIPVLLCGTVFFVFDKLTVFLNLLEPELQQWNRYTLIHIAPKQLLPVGFVLITGIIGGISFQRYLPKMVVQLRTYFNVYFRLLFFVLLMNGIHRSNGLQHYMLLAVPLSVPVAYTLARAKRLLWIDIWWYFIIFLIVAMPYIR